LSVKGDPEDEKKPLAIVVREELREQASNQTAAYDGCQGRRHTLHV
jgi:hypothetical protein